MVIVLLADGFEEIEALTPVDMLRRGGIEVKTVGINGKIAVGSHGISVVADAVPEDINLDDVSMVVFPGGMPGSLNLDASPYTNKVIESVLSRGGHLAAICAAPLVFGRRGLLSGKRATCYPGFESELVGASATGEDVVTDGNITTARGMGVAIEFAEELLSLCVGKERASEIDKSICRSRGVKAAVLPRNQGQLYAEDYIGNPQFRDAVMIALDAGHISTALIQRKLSIGYGKAATFIDAMHELGIAGDSDGANPRKTLMTVDEWNALLEEKGLKNNE